MKLPITTSEKIRTPEVGFGFAFIDEDDHKLKIKKHNSTIEFTNTLSDIQLLNLSDYTAFEVFAHNYHIGAEYSGTYADGSEFNNGQFTSTGSPSGNWNIYNGYIAPEFNNTKIYFAIPANMTHVITIRTTCADYQESDIIIDWGDGNLSSVFNGDFNGIEYLTEIRSAILSNQSTYVEYCKSNFVDTVYDPNANEGNYTFSHTYSQNGRYIIKIYGRKYYSLKPGFEVKTPGGSSQYYRNYNNNLQSRVFDHDLPVASHITNFSNWCRGAFNLITLNAENIKYRNIINASSIANTVWNLQTAVNFGRNFVASNMNSAFYNCISLMNSDAVLPYLSVYSNACEYMYNRCYRLGGNFNNLLPDSYFSPGPKSMAFTFENCGLGVKNYPSQLSGTLDASRLWNSKNVFTNTSNAFKNFALKDQVPISWGGTGSDNLINPTLEERISELENS